MRRLSMLGVAALITAGSILTAPAATAGETTFRPVRTCADLVRTYDLPGAVTHVETATVVPATATEPENCDVRGHVEPAVRFQLRLPTKTYAGRYLQFGCGGFCGMVNTPPFADCGLPHGGDVAVAATDDGHVGKTPSVFDDGKWAENDQAARDDFAFRAPHVVSKASKRVIAAFYGAPPKKSYFSGCSDGGREALLLAQRYPHDFDGIVAGAPAGYWGPLLGVYQTWLARVNTGADGKPILTADKLPALHTAALSSCDRSDGLTDGAIDDPRTCRFDPATIACPPGTDNAGCLTPAQVEATKKIYAPPADEHGRKLYPGGQTVGSELSWYGWIIPAPEFGGVPVAQALADNYLKYMAYPIGTPHSSVEKFAFTAREFDRLTPEGVRSNAMSPDLGEFRRSGGKLVIWHGWADQAIPAAGSVDYYQRLARANGGLAATSNWARLFMVPGLYHCATGDKLTEYDPLKELVSWVERGVAPDRTIATGRDADGKVFRTRPVFPYPLQAKYDGTGSVDDAANFVPVPPSRPSHDIVNWAGNDLYGKVGPVAP
ncbi:tannase/feruloyl esterase family alpha/beta hydrolase [Amycolatopsis orientalis]|uniref:tannase/feruloyl esterase family alpha/beta hydrolase n=1 Tax=Amycolatopsis orientalis TaxID=31958 RepID=UPI00055E56A6|nr:tannase/feruloyl esterase family alpha/beta hydrolase [Amycolatopsis orientalis]